MTGIRQNRHFIKFKLNHRKKLFLCTSEYIAYKIKTCWTKRNFKSCLLQTFHLANKEAKVWWRWEVILTYTNLLHIISNTEPEASVLFSSLYFFLPHHTTSFFCESYIYIIAIKITILAHKQFHVNYEYTYTSLTGRQPQHVNFYSCSQWMLKIYHLGVQVIFASRFARGKKGMFYY